MTPLPDRWTALTLSASGEAAETAAHFLMERGALGTVYGERLFDPSGDPADPLPPEEATTTVTGYFPEGTDLSAIEADVVSVIASIFGEGAATAVSHALVTDDGWSEKWKEHFRPQRVGKRLVVRPTWEPFKEEPGDVVLLVDPGQAFGTGTHETTRLCLRAIEALYSGEEKPSRVLDVGTGTGILAIAALKLGAKEALGIDIDPLSIEASTQNADVNGVGNGFRAVTTPLADVAGRFPLVVANIIAEAVIHLKNELVARTSTGGLLLLSGIIGSKGGWVASEFKDAGARLLSREDDGAWCALLFRVPGK